MKLNSAIASSMLLLTLTACSGVKPQGLGLTNGNLAVCPDSPNCVNSLATDDVHAIAPMALVGTPSSAEVIEKIKQALTELPRLTIIEQTDVYLYAEAQTKIMRFVDDVEFVVNTDQGLIHVCSASRKGYKDFDVNRERIETVRNLLLKQGTISR